MDDSVAREYNRNDSFVTLGDGNQTGRSAKDRNASFSQTTGTFDMTGIVDQRLKPQSLRRHRKSEFEQYLPRHLTNSPNMNVAPYPIDEKGRLKKTQVLDHIIKMKRDVNRKNESIKEKIKR